VLLAIGHQPCDLSVALKATADNLRRTAIELGNLIAITTKTNTQFAFDTLGLKD